MDNYKGMKIATVPADLGFGFVFNYNDLVSRVVKAEDGYMWTSPSSTHSSDLLEKREAVFYAVLHIAPELHEPFMIEYDKEVVVASIEEVLSILSKELSGGDENILILEAMELDVDALLLNAKALTLA